MCTGSNCDVVAILGDIGGHVDVFHRWVASLGVDVQRPIFPAGLTVVQVGDLVHKGPDSDECVAYAQLLMDLNGPAYVQLVGNHEAHYLAGGPSVAGRAGVVEIDGHSVRRLQSWWESGAMRLAAAARFNDFGDTVITHGGLTSGFFAELGYPENAVDAVAALNALKDPEVAFRPGWLTTGVVTGNVSPINPRVGSELLPGWINYDGAPFTQIHGHEGAWRWRDSQWHDDVPQWMVERIVLDPLYQHSWTVLGDGHRIWSVDPMFGVPSPSYVPPVLRLCGQVL